MTLPGGRQHRLGQGMFGGALHGGGHLQQIRWVRGIDPGHRRTPVSQGPGLVQTNRIHRRQRLQCCPLAKQHAQLRGTPRTDHHCCRSSQPHRTGTGHHQHRDCREHGKGDRRRWPEQQPEEETQQGDQDHQWCENPHHPVCQTLDRQLARLCLLHQPDDLRQHRTLAHRGRPDQQAPFAVHRAAHHRITLFFALRQWLTGEHGRIHMGVAIHDHAIHGQTFPWPDHHLIARHDGADRDLQLGTVAQYMRFLRLQTQQLFDRCGSPPLRQFFQIFTEEHCGNHYRRGVEIDMPGAGGKPGRRDKDQHAI